MQQHQQCQHPYYQNRRSRSCLNWRRLVGRKLLPICLVEWWWVLMIKRYLRILLLISALFIIAPHVLPKVLISKERWLIVWAKVNIQISPRANQVWRIFNVLSIVEASLSLGLDLFGDGKVLCYKFAPSRVWCNTRCLPSLLMMPLFLKPLVIDLLLDTAHVVPNLRKRLGCLIALWMDMETFPLHCLTYFWLWNCIYYTFWIIFHKFSDLVYTTFTTILFCFIELVIEPYVIIKVYSAVLSEFLVSSIILLHMLSPFLPLFSSCWFNTNFKTNYESKFRSKFATKSETKSKSKLGTNIKGLVSKEWSLGNISRGGSCFDQHHFPHCFPYHKPHLIPKKNKKEYPSRWHS